jgi:hypothetical protein
VTWNGAGLRGRAEATVARAMRRAWERNIVAGCEDGVDDRSRIVSLRVSSLLVYLLGPWVFIHGIWRVYKYGVYSPHLKTAAVNQ